MLRVTQITLPASPLGTPFNTEVDRLREFVRLASEDGIRLSIKTEGGHLTEDPHTAVELCQAVRGLGLTLDPSYYMLGPNAGRSYDQVFPYVYHTHLRDSTSQSLQVQVGLGELDYTRLINQLKRRWYNRALSIEILPTTENVGRATAGTSQTANAARHAAVALRFVELLAGLRRNRTDCRTVRSVRCFPFLPAAGLCACAGSAPAAGFFLGFFLFGPGLQRLERQAHTLALSTSTSSTWAMTTWWTSERRRGDGPACDRAR